MARPDSKTRGEPLVCSAAELLDYADRCGLLLIAAGFEERAREIVRIVGGRLKKKLLIVEYKSDIEENDVAAKEIEDLLFAIGGEVGGRVELDPYGPLTYSGSLREGLERFEMEAGKEAWVDVSGLPQWAIAESLRLLRLRFPFTDIIVLYTAAAEYFPTRAEYLKSSVHKAAKTLQTDLPKSLTLEMADNLILEGFSGVSLKEYSSCLLLFAGYEKHRSLGAIEQVNPSRLVLVYGRPGDTELHWRLEMSKQLHETLVTERPTAQEEVSTLNVVDVIEVIERYYEYLYDDHNFSVALVCSKMQAVGTFLAWERLRDIQLVFPLPVRYLPKRFSRGVGKTYRLELPPPPGVAAFASFERLVG